MSSAVATLKQEALRLLPELAAKYFPRAKIENGELQAGDLHGSSGQSFRLQMDGKYKGNWIDWATGDRGDILDLIQRRHGYQNVLDVAKALGVQIGEARPAASPPPQTQPEDPPDKGRDEELEKERRWRYLWNEEAAEQDMMNSTSMYLHSRGFTGTDYSFDKRQWGPAPRFARNHRMKNHDEKKVRGAVIFPCLSLHRDHADHLRMEGLWRVFVGYDGKKTTEDTPRAGLGKMKGCVYPFVFNIKPDHWPNRMNHRILLAEGIETTLAWHLLTGYNNACLSCFSSGNIPAVASRLVELANPETYLNDFRPLVYVAGDNDEAGANAAHKAVNILREGGLEARTIFPPEGFNDANDLLIARRNGDWNEYNPWLY